MFRILVVICGLVLTGAPALAAPEVHVVGIYEGYGRSNGEVHGPLAKVVLDRPGAEVLLVLMSQSAVRWDVEVAEGRGQRARLSRPWFWHRNKRAALAKFY